jgi:hypothetical protein
LALSESIAEGRRDLYHETSEIRARRAGMADGDAGVDPGEATSERRERGRPDGRAEEKHLKRMDCARRRQGQEAAQGRCWSKGLLPISGKRAARAETKKANKAAASKTRRQA